MELDKYKSVSTVAKDLRITPQWVYVLIERKTLNGQLIDNITFVIIDSDYETYKKWRTWRK